MDDHLPSPMSQPAPVMATPMQERTSTRFAAPPSSSTLDVAAIVFALFKHKWKIIGFSLTGFALAVAAYVSIKPTYRSEAKLLIKYIVDDKLPIGAGADTEVRKLDVQAATIITTEMEILASKDLAEQVVTKIGPERILGNPAAVDDHHRAAEYLKHGLVVDLPNRMATVIRVAYTHKDPAVAQAVVRNLVDAYLAKHVEIHRRSGQTEKFLVEEIDSSRATLLQMEEELRKLKERAGTDSIPDARKIFADQAARLQQDLMSTEAALAESRALLEARTGRTVDTSATAPVAVEAVPAAKSAEYQRASTLLATLMQREQEYLLQYTRESLIVQGVRGQIADQERVLRRLEEEYPTLRGSAAAVPVTAGVPLPPVFDRAAEEARIVQLEARKKVLTEQLAETRANSAALGQLEPLITELERATEIEKTKYLNIRNSLNLRETERKLTGGMNTNILDIQEPSAPVRVPGTRMAVVAGLLFGGLAAGLGLALGLELFLDQSVRRPKEIESSMGLPLFFSIPFLKNVTKTGTAVAALPAAKKGAAPAGAPSGAGPLVPGGGGAAPAWSPAHGLRSFFDALRDRLVFYFEIRNFTRKPKLIAVAGCNDASGVSTIASGLAASLSESGDGNVLLVDMNPGNKTPFHFHKGELKVGLDDALENEKRDDAMVRNNLYVVSHASGQDKLNAILPKRFTNLVPKLKASDYDYIIFDLPPINHISATPQLARYMDMTLMVVESEKTARETTKRVGSMFTEAGVNFGVVLNKTRDYLPRTLRNMLSSEA